MTGFANKAQSKPEEFRVKAPEGSDIAALKAQVEAVAEPICRALGLDLVDISYGREREGTVLRILIDRPVESDPTDLPRSGVSLTDCQELSRDLSTALDVHDTVPGAYRLEVSSPGIERPLVKLSDFERFAKREIKLQTRSPVSERRRFQGELLGVEGTDVLLSQDGRPIRIPHREVAKANLVVRFGTGRKNKKSK